MSLENMMVVFDLDGTLRDATLRVNKYLIGDPATPETKREKIDWDGFFLACDTDTPIPHAISVLRALHDAGHTIWIWTGCSEIAREQSEEQLMMWGIPPEILANRLIMRKIDDRRNDDEVKPEWIKLYGKPDLVFEDRNRVVDAWRAMGVPCYHVAPGDF